MAFLTCHCHLLCLFLAPSLFFFLATVAGLLQVSSSDLSTALTSDVQYFKGIALSAFSCSPFALFSSNLSVSRGTIWIRGIVILEETIFIMMEMLQRTIK